MRRQGVRSHRARRDRGRAKFQDVASRLSGTSSRELVRATPNQIVWTRRRATGAALSLVALLAAIGLRWLLDPVLHDVLPLVTLYGAVTIAVLLGGAWQATAIALLAYLACDYLFIQPRGELHLGEADSVVGFLAYCFTCSLIIALGVTMRRARARALEQHEALRVTLHSIGDAVITTDLVGHITYLNEVAEQLTGWSAAEARAQPLDRVFRIVDEATRAPASSPAERALREGAIVGLANHTILVRRDGTEVAIDDSAAPIRDEQGRVSGCVLTFRDVAKERSDHRRRESQFDAARVLAAIVESSELAMVSKSLDGTIQSWNAAAERLFGHAASRAIGQHISLVIPPERRFEEDQIIASLKQGRRIEHLETERIRADGSRVQVALSIAPVRDETGRVVGASKIARDITRERAIAAKLAAEERRKDEFLATLSHELRGPLAPLTSVLDIWKSTDDGAKLANARTTMERQLNQLVRLVDDLLDLNRISHDRLELRRARLELRAVVNQAVETVTPLAKSRQHELVVDLPAEPIAIEADAARLAQVFSNLLINACKFTPAGGRLAIRARGDAGTVVVTVRDSGVGIPADKLESIFEMFVQANPEVQRGQSGLGIGLTLVKRLVAMHGGTVEARSEGSGRGSEFVISLPLAAEPGANGDRDPVGAGGAAAPLRKRRILVVDDNVDSAESLANLLEMDGHETFTAHDGAAAVAAATSHRPDVVLLDIGLPKLTGHEVCVQIRSQAWGHEPVIIALTGWGQAEDRRKSQEAGFDGHLMKPVRYRDLREMLKTAAR